MSTITARAGRIGLGLALTLAAIGGGAASAAPTAGDSASTETTATTAMAGTRPVFQMPFRCDQEWRGSAWWYYDGHEHSPLRSVDWNQGSGNDDKGLAVLASSGGTVLHAGPHPSGYGNMVLIGHGDGWRTRYAHLLDGSVAVRKDQAVNRGQLIGRVGQSGGQSSSHLHYEQIKDGSVVNSIVRAKVNGTVTSVEFTRDKVAYLKSNNNC